MIDCQVFENTCSERYRNNEHVSVAFTVTDYDSSSDRRMSFVVVVTVSICIRRDRFVKNCDGLGSWNSNTFKHIRHVY